MAVSFVTRFRRHIAKIPYVIVVLVPVALVILLFVNRHQPSGRAEPHANLLCSAEVPAPDLSECRVAPQD